MDRRYQRGFTLIELAIDLVIVGLIVAAIVAGQTLVKQVKLRSIISDLSNYDTAFNSFRLEFNALPGDMLNANSFWASCADDGQNDCNGNGDGVITIQYTGPPAGRQYEGMRMWQHLTLSGALQGSFTGTDQIGNGHQFNPDINAPATPYSADSCYFGNALSASWGGTADAAIIFGGSRINNVCESGLIEPEDAYTIDGKIDNNDRSTGKIRALDGQAASGCVSGANYVLTNTGSRCQMAYVVKD